MFKNLFFAIFRGTSDNTMEKNILRHEIKGGWLKNRSNSYHKEYCALIYFKYALLSILRKYSACLSNS